MHYSTFKSEMQVHIFLKMLDKHRIMVYNTCIDNAYFEIYEFRYTHYLYIKTVYDEEGNDMRAQFITAAEVEKALGVSRSKAYQIIRTLNRELKAMGYITIAGKCPIQYFQRKFYGIQMGPDTAANG